MRDLHARGADIAHAVSVRGMVLYATNRGRRVFALVPVADGEAAERGRLGGEDPEPQ